MSLWTPGGEVPIDRGRADSPSPRPDEQVPEMLSDDQLRSLGLDPAQLSDEERAQATAVVAQMAESQARIAAAPAADVIANHAMGLYELAAIKLGTEPMQLDDAQLAIDALGALLDGLEGRLGDNAETLSQARLALQQAFVEATGASS